MNVEILAVAYLAWGAIGGVIYHLGDEEGSKFAWYGWSFPVCVAIPPAWFLLLDGEWSEGDCALIACILFPVSMLILLGRCGQWILDTVLHRIRSVPEVEWLSLPAKSEPARVDGARPPRSVTRAQARADRLRISQEGGGVSERSYEAEGGQNPWPPASMGLCTKQRCGEISTRIDPTAARIGAVRCSAPRPH